MSEIKVKDLTLQPQQIVNYFTPPSSGIRLGIILIIISLVLYVIDPIACVISLLASVSIIVIRAKKRKKIITDKEIDAQWIEIAKQREDEAYRVAHVEKSDAIRDAQFFWAGPHEIQQGDGAAGYKVKEGVDNVHRRNYQRLVYMIYTQNQLVVFDENICIENNWQGKDYIQEYYWKDVSSIGFDQKDNTLEICCGPKVVTFPLEGDKTIFQTIFGAEEKFSTESAEAISNSIRVMLREIKTS